MKEERKTMKIKCFLEGRKEDVSLCGRKLNEGRLIRRDSTKGKKRGGRGGGRRGGGGRGQKTKKQHEQV